MENKKLLVTPLKWSSNTVVSVRSQTAKGQDVEAANTVNLSRTLAGIEKQREKMPWFTEVQHVERSAGYFSVGKQILSIR